MNENDDVLIFGDNVNICRKIIGALSKQGINASMPIVAGRGVDDDIFRVVEFLKERQLVLVFQNEKLKKITEIFHCRGITELYIYPWDTHFIDNNNINKCFLKIDNNKPRLDYVEIEISETCNLNCKGCSEFSNLVEGKKFTDINRFRSDLIKLKKYFWGIGKIRLLGGEPLTNPDYPTFVAIARELFPDSDIRLVSNGLLIPLQDKEKLAAIKYYNCSFDISNYPPTKKRIDMIKSCLNKADIKYNISIPVKIFFKTILSEPLESSSESYNNCMFSYCHSLRDGCLSACTTPLYIDRLNKAFHLTYPTDDKICLDQTDLNGWEINESFEKPHDFCRYCSKGLVSFKWRICPGIEAKPEDWIIKRTIFNAMIIPITQKPFKPFAERLRYILQSPRRKRK